MPLPYMLNEEKYTSPAGRPTKRIDCINSCCHAVLLALLAGGINFHPRFHHAQSALGITMIVMLMTIIVFNIFFLLGEMHKLGRAASRVVKRRVTVVSLITYSIIVTIFCLADLSLAAHSIRSARPQASTYVWLILAFIDLPVFSWVQIWLFLRPRLLRGNLDHIDRPSSRGSSERSTSDLKGEYAIMYENIPTPPPSAILRSTTTMLQEEHIRSTSFRNSLQDYIVSPTVRLLHRASFRSETTTVADPQGSVSRQSSFNWDHDCEKGGAIDGTSRATAPSRKSSSVALARLETIPDNGTAPLDRTPRRASSQPLLTAAFDSEGAVEGKAHSIRQSASAATLVPSRQRSDSASTSQSHIHPLFRTDSPLPPPAASPGTIFTASPWGGRVCDADRAMSLTRPASSTTLRRPSLDAGVGADRRRPLALGDRNRSKSSLRNAARDAGPAGTASSGGGGGIAPRTPLRSVKSADAMGRRGPALGGESFPPPPPPLLPRCNALGISVGAVAVAVRKGSLTRRP